MARAKICGLKTLGDVEACIDAGAGFVGFVDFDKSPRHIDPAQAKPLLDAAAAAASTASAAASTAAGKATRVLLTVDAQDSRLAQWMALGGIDMIQAHGGESPQRVDELRQLSGLPVMKACGVRTREDVLAAVQRYGAHADWLLFDAKPPSDSQIPGGNAHAFDWSIVHGVDMPVPWMLAGGLDAANVAQAIAISGAHVVDVSSGVERARGQKDATKIAEFLKAVEAAG